MVMTLTEAFSRLGKIVPVYSKLAAVILKLENGKFYASGIARGQSFHFEVELKDTDTPDFYITVSPAELVRVLKLTVSKVKYSNGELKISGSFGNGDGVPTIELSCKSVMEALANDVEKIESKTFEYIAALDDTAEMCKATDVLQPWQALAKCGKRIFITENLTYSTSPATNAFYWKEGACKNLPETEEPLQAESSFVAELSVLQQAFNSKEFSIYSLLNGTVFLALSSDRSVFAVEGAPVRIEKNTLDRITRRYEAVSEFDTLTLPQSAVRDILQTAADKADVQIHVEDDSLSFSSGAFGKIKVDTSEFACACEVAREHTSLALGALPMDSEMVFGYGDSEGRNFISFNAKDVTIIVPVQDITEVE